jgi:hypothetical protein
MSDIEKTLREFSHLIESEDPIILQRLQIEVQMETLRQTANVAAMIETRLYAMTELLKTMDWKLWESVKILNPLLDGNTTAPVAKVDPVVSEVITQVEPKQSPVVDIEDDEFHIIDGKLVKR